MKDSYAVLGEYDFIIVIEATDRKSLFQASLKIEEYGLDMQTMEVTETDRFAELVEDV